MAERNFAPEDVQAILIQLDQAIYNHQQWQNGVSRTMICDLPPDDNDLGDCAHQNCRFGQWYYRQAPASLRRHPGFEAIGAEHEHMHHVAADLLRAAGAGQRIDPIDYDNLANSIDRMRLEILTLKRELEETLYNSDPLTGAVNRVGMLTKLRELQELVRRGVQQCCIVMMDLDMFKLVNDRHGHQAGDRVLAGCAHFVMEHVRPYDRVFRYGGEEFLISMQNTDAERGAEVMERIRAGLETLAIDVGGQAPVHVTASFGISMLDPDVPVERAIERADGALYAAKQAGRNTVRIWTPLDPV